MNDKNIAAVAAAAKAAPKPRFQLVIDLTDDGDINVRGPINDRVLAFGMLECAKNIIANFEPGAIQLLDGTHANVKQVPTASKAAGNDTATGGAA